MGRLVQHRRVVRLEHQLAVLRRRDDALLLLADVRPRGSELRLCRGRDRGAGRLHPRARVALEQRAGELLRRPHPRAALHPAAAVGDRGLFLLSQGTLQSLGDYTTVKTLTGLDQTLAQGPVASQEAIKLLGTNGGGFFNVNSAMPFENPTWLTNFVQMLMILVIPAGLTATYGRMVGSRRQGWAVFGAMIGAVRRRRRADLRRRDPSAVAHGRGRVVRRRTSRARSSASGSPPRRCSRPSPPPPRAAR